MSNLDVELTPELVKRAQKRVDYIFSKGSSEPGVSTKIIDTNLKPVWYDEERFKEAQQIAREYISP